MSVYKGKNRYLIVACICTGDIREVGVEIGVADCLSYRAGGSNPGVYHYARASWILQGALNEKPIEFPSIRPHCSLTR